MVMEMVLTLGLCFMPISDEVSFSLISPAYIPINPFDPAAPTKYRTLAVVGEFRI
jgi:hypothetical protein